MHNESLFDLIVLDLNMPISDGYEACKNIVNLYADNKKLFKMQNKRTDSGSSNILVDKHDDSHHL